jgi:hypothetical protein
MLSEPERRSLADIEGRLSAEDPNWFEGFDATQRRLAARTRPAWQRAVLVIGASIAAVLALLAFFAGIPSLTTFFILCTALSVWLVDRPVRPPDQRDREDRTGPAEGRS